MRSNSQQPATMLFYVSSAWLCAAQRARPWESSTRQALAGWRYRTLRVGRRWGPTGPQCGWWNSKGHLQGCCRRQWAISLSHSLLTASDPHHRPVRRSLHPAHSRACWVQIATAAATRPRSPCGSCSCGQCAIPQTPKFDNPKFDKPGSAESTLVTGPACSDCLPASHRPVCAVLLLCACGARAAFPTTK